MKPTHANNGSFATSSWHVHPWSRARRRAQDVNPLLVTKPGAVERFEREVKAAAQMVHPNIVTAFDAEKVGDMHVLVMEYVEGDTLAQVILGRREFIDRHRLRVPSARLWSPFVH